MAQLFELLGFTVRHDVDVGGHQVDLLLELRLGPIASRFVVECKDLAKPVGSEDYQQLYHRLLTAKSALGEDVRAIFVTTVGYTRHVTTQAQHNGVHLLTISELEQSIVDLRPYVRDLHRELMDDRALEHFVEPGVRRESRSRPERALRFFDAWLGDPLSNHLTLLGDYGTGKTTVLKYLCRRMAAEAEERGRVAGGRTARVRVPLFVHLPDYPKAAHFGEILRRFLDENQVGAASLKAFDHVSRDGQLLLVLDGFDEMAGRGDAEAALRLFREINQRARGKAKIILACRTHYFTTHDEVRTLLGQTPPDLPLPKAYTDLYQEIAGRRNFAIVHLEEFSADEVAEYLERRCGERAPAIRKLIESTYELRDISRRPALLDMIIASGERLESAPGTITPGFLYAVFTGIWLESNRWTTIITPKAKAELLERLAHHAENRPDAHFPRGDIPALISRWKRDVSKDDLEKIDRELRAASFLVVDERGHYTFSHPSFQEFFYARHLLSEARRGHDILWRQGSYRKEIYRFLRDLLSQDPESVASLRRWIGDEEVEVAARINAVKCLAGALDEAIVDELLALFDGDAPEGLQAAVATTLGHADAPRVVERLSALVVEDRLKAVRANALIALARIHADEAIAFLVDLLDGHILPDPGEMPLLWPLYHVASQMSGLDGRLGAALIRHYRRHVLRTSRRPKGLQPCLELCRLHPSAEARELLDEVLRRTRRPSVAAAAMRALPAEERPHHARRIVDLVESPKIRRVHQGDYLRALVESLAGIASEEVADALERLVARENDGKIAAVAFKVLAGDHPRRAERLAKRFLPSRRPVELRLEMADWIAGHDGETSRSQILELLESFFNPRDRAAAKIQVLNRIARSFPDKLAPTIDRLWDDEPAQAVKGHAVELLQSIDREASLELLSGRCVVDPRVGLRATACELLAGEPDARATAALLERLREDHAASVRRQAFHGLLGPERECPAERILEASENEEDPDILRLRRELLRS